ncbi:MAG: hypothetical protein SPK48_05390 [Bullifex sp.]|nr:hypothetical protein [Spirochaetales bacterium]MDY5777257.1 hypothetical protein [Bullifex sp.]
MSFLRLQNIVRDQNGTVIRGSASIMDTVYDRERIHKSRQMVVERLGKVVWYDSDKRQGIFQSELRGLVGYDETLKSFFEVKPDDVRVMHHVSHEAPRHFVFGEADLFLSFMEKEGFTGLLRKIFTKEEDFSRVMCHLAHTVMRNGSRIKCDDFVENSLLSHCISGLAVNTLASDTAYFSMMGRDEVKLSVFREYVKLMRKRHGDGFGKGCFVDSTPLPNDMDSPFNAFSSHGTGGAANQMRLATILDAETLLPIWYEIIPGNVVDVSTMAFLRNSVAEALDISISDYTLDAGYCSMPLISAFCPEWKDDDGGDDTDTCGEAEECDGETGSPCPEIKGRLVVRMPNRRGYPYKLLWHKLKDQIMKGKNFFRHESHIYFGKRVIVRISGRKVYAYVFVDTQNAFSALSDFMDRHPEEYAAMKDKDRDFRTFEGGYFILLSNMEMEPKEVLSVYFSRTLIESYFKTAKTYLDLLPLSKWSDLTVRGKILNDMVASVIYVGMRNKANADGKSMTDLLGPLGGNMAIVTGKESRILVDTPSTKVKNLRKIFGVSDVSNRTVDEYLKLRGLKV